MASRRSVRGKPRVEDAWSRTLALIFLASLAVRVLYVGSIRHAYFFTHLQTEPLRYQEWASAILDAPSAPRPPFDEAPGYPYFVAAVFGLFGRGVTAVALVQTVLDALSCVLIAVAGGGWFGRRAGTLAGVLAALYGPLIYFSGELLPVTLVVCLMVAAIATVAAPPASMAASLGHSSAGVSSARRRAGATAHVAAVSPRRWLLAGGLWAAALVVRVEVLLALPLVLIDAWRRGRRAALSRIAAPVVLVLALSVALNAFYGRRLVLTTTGAGLNLWLGNNSSGDGVNPFIWGPLVPVADGVRARAASGADADRTFRAYAWAFFREQPAAALRLLWKKAVWTWTDRELPNTSDIEWQTAQSAVFWPPVFPLRFGVLLPVAAAGVVLMGREAADLAALWGLVVMATGTCLIFFTNARFRVVMAPALLVAAAAALDRAVTLTRQWRTQVRRLLWATLAFAVGAVAAWGDFYAVREYEIPEIAVNTGVLEREANHFESAVRHLRLGLAAHPYDAIGWVHLALALEQTGATPAALHAYFDALALMPADKELLDMAGRFFDRHGLDRAALRAYANAADGAQRAAIAHDTAQKMAGRE